MSDNLKDNCIKIKLSGRIDSGNAAQVEKDINDQIAAWSESTDAQQTGSESLRIDMSDLEYISSAGLRILLRLKKKFGEMQLEEVNPTVYEVLQTTGFTELMDVQKGWTRISVEGCEVIGSGANGTVYRIDGDNVVKVSNDANALEEIQHEREVARLALVLGIPTAISYDVVRVGDSYGSVYELLESKPFSRILAEEPERMDWCVQEYVKLLHKIHSTVVPEGKLPDIRETVTGWAQFLQGYLPAGPWTKLCSLIAAVPKNDHMIHGDYHTKNIQLSGGEVLLIDMDTLAVGHPVFELASMYNSFVGFGEYDRGKVDRFMGFDSSIAAEFWRKSLAAYLETDDEALIRSVEDKARVVGYTRMIRRSIRRGGLETEEGRAEIELWKTHLLELLDRINTITFEPDEIRLEASVKNLPKVMKFLDEHMDDWHCSFKERNTIELAVEEVYINIANYAYMPGRGEVTIRAGLEEAPDGSGKRMAVFTFIDQGTPYNPLTKEDPDVSLPAGQRRIGGLGVFLVKRTMDDVHYEYQGGSNILTIKKRIS